MVIAFIAFGVLFGAAAAVYTLVSGGSILLALAAYSGVGTLAALAIIFLLLWVSERDTADADWADAKDGREPVSA